MSDEARVLLVDDHAIVRLGLRTLLESHQDVRVVGEAGSAAEALEMVEKLQPAIVILDIKLPGTSGIEACRQIKVRWPQVNVIMLTSFEQDEMISQAIQAGAAGYVLKQVGTEELIRAIRAVHRGEALLDPQVTARLLANLRKQHPTDSAFQGLTEREMEILKLVAKGKTNNEIGADLFLSDKTIRNHVSVMLEKLHLKNRVELASYALEHHVFER